MKIKQPESDNALCSFCKHLDDAQFTLNNCASQHHNVTSVVYISSLLVMPNVVHNGVNIIDKISNLARTVPNSICLIRTTSPQYFRGNMRTLQRMALNRLRTNCYVVVFTPYQEFLNHAKFLIHYNFCLSEQVVHYGLYFGSTNLTQVGLGNPHLHSNFEEFAESDRVKHAYNTNSKDRKYLKEVLDLINYKAWIYTDFNYLTKHVSRHIESLENLTSQRKIGSVSRAGNFKKYVSTMASYNQTLAFLDDLPGKKLTADILEEITSIYPPFDPLELEALSGEYDEETINNLLDDGPLLQKAETTSNNAVRSVLGFIQERYKPNAKKIKENMDEKELDFLEDLTNYHGKRTAELDGIINPEKHQ